MSSDEETVISSTGVESNCTSDDSRKKKSTSFSMSSDEETVFSSTGVESTCSSSDEDTISRKKRSIEDVVFCDTDAKKIKLRVSIEETIEVELDKLISKPKTLLARMVTSNLAKPNESGEYEIKDINPVVFKDIINYYVKGEITKQNYIEDLRKTCNYLQVRINRKKTEKSLHKLITQDREIKRGFKYLYYHHMVPFMKSNDAYKEYWIFILVNDEIHDEFDYEDIDRTIQESEKTCDEVVFINERSYKSITGDLFKEFLSVRGMDDFSIEDGEVEREVNKCHEDDNDEYELIKYKILKIHNKYTAK